ncbi:ArsR/SmtB family transcription factor [Vandammella animalimorsus]|uniref:ArsR/SmtB family transcription factor n=1 Tax=Vandammella animalimorsus TaxID=2029117 RepID=UPI001EEDBE53|nr:metalloregulator ArsR/SmtB family transcription factor [Vandammella animalimorsus]
MTSPCQHDQATPPAMQYPARQLELAAAMCHALSDPARLRLLLWLAEREMCVSELVACEGGKLSSVSARLQTLHAAGLVTRRREAKHIFYALADEHVHELLRNILHHAAEYPWKAAAR